MRHTIGVVLLAASSIVLYRWSNHTATRDVLRWQIKDDEPFYHVASHNCTFTSCYNTSPCVLNSSHVTFYIQPLIELLDKNGTRITPDPSQEFLEIRRFLAPYAVQDPSQACLSFPGVDFLNFDRFNSESDIQRIVSVLKNRLPNIVIFNFLGKAPAFDVILVSSIPGRDAYRPQFDLSLPLILPPSEIEEIKEHRNLLLIPLINVLGLQKHEILSDLGETKATFLNECPKNPSKTCTDSGVEVDLEGQIRNHQFVLLLESSSVFPRMLTLSLKHGTIPMIYGDLIILPFSRTIDWSRSSLSPSSPSRIPHILGRLTPTEIERMAANGRLLHQKVFSSLFAVMATVMKELEIQILPAVHNQECVPLLPHLVAESSVCGFVVGEDITVIATVSKLCSSTSITKVVVLWSSDDNPPSPDEWICQSKLVEVVYGGGDFCIAEAARMNKDRCNSVFFVPKGVCPFHEGRLAEAVDIWQSVPHNVVNLPASDGVCTPPFLLHIIYVAYCLSPEELLLLSQKQSNLPAVHLIEKTGKPTKGAASVLV